METIAFALKAALLLFNVTRHGRRSRGESIDQLVLSITFVTFMLFHFPKEASTDVALVDGGSSTE